MTKLGRGLGALINFGLEKEDVTTGITTLKIDFIKPNRYQPRKIFNPEKLNELAISLKENGIIQPIIVTKQADSDYELVAGERRLEAAKLAGFNDVPVIIRSVSKKEQLQLAIIENVQREDLNGIEEAKAYKQLNTEFGLTHSEISNIVGKDRATISNLVRLLKLSNSIQNLVLMGKLSSGHARAILSVEEKLQNNFADFIIKHNLSVRKAEAEAKRLRESNIIAFPSKKYFRSNEFDNYESELNKLYSLKVKISQNDKKGKISFYYNDEKELQILLENLKK